jgi:biopolymer transport protein ExbD
MNLKLMLSKRKKSREEDINLLNIMDMFLIMIIFLLQTGAFLKLAIIELVLPSLSKGQSQVQTQQQENLVLIVLAIRENGFQLKSLGFKFDPILKSNNQYNYAILVEQLKVIKQQHPQAEDIIIAPESKVKYSTIITVMDRCRETGFPNISLSG